IAMLQKPMTSLSTLAAHHPNIFWVMVAGLSAVIIYCLVLSIKALAPTPTSPQNKQVVPVQEAASVPLAEPPAVPQTAQEPQHFLDLGLKLFRQHNVDGALEAFTKAIELNPQLSPAYDARAKARTRQGDLVGAIADYTKAIEIEPTLVNSYYTRGL